MTGLSSGNLNAARYFFRAGTDISVLSGSLVLIRRTFDVNSPEIVLPKLSSMVPSTTSGLVTAGASRALLQTVEIDGSEFPLSPSDLEDKRSDFLQVSAGPPNLLATDRE